MPQAGLNLTGKGEIVAIADTGLDTGVPATLHLDFQGRLKNIQSFPIVPSLSSYVTNPGGDDGPIDQYSGHGTHVAGSVLGNGARAKALGLTPVMGMAPEADLVFQAIEQTPKWTSAAQLDFLRRGEQAPTSGLYGIPDNLKQLFQQAYDLGARIHSNSWGGGTPGEYDTQCEDLDRFMWENKDFLVLVAAGNSGADRSPTDGSIDPGSVDSPGTAKNCLTVGASENNRPGEFSAIYGQWWTDKFPGTTNISKDSMIDNPDDIVAFSSRGPCTTGRRKPDVVAPGTFILSARSSKIANNNFAWAAFPPAKQDYMFMGGTSMATPLVAGAAVLVRQYLRTTAGHTNPSAALIKATIIHSAQYLNYRYAHPSSSRWADNEQGWGRVTLEKVLVPQLPTKVLFVDESSGLKTGEFREYSIQVQDSTVPLRVTLVYTDYPGEKLVNNLNLIVSNPGNTTFSLGNDFTKTGVPDALNNVEGVVVDTPATGLWKIRIVASEVQRDEQDFALVISGVDISKQ